MPPFLRVFSSSSLSAPPSAASAPVTPPAHSPSSSRSSSSAYPSSQPHSGQPTPSHSLDQSGYFQPTHRPVNAQDAFKAVRAMEDLLAAWNEYRIALTNVGKTGRKLAGAMRDAAACVAKTEVPAQTLRPAAAALDDVADVTIKFSKHVDQAYDSANSSASKYFGLLAKETRAHEAYLATMRKKHDKSEKAYRRASKDLAETSTAHATLLTFQAELALDLRRAEADHTDLLRHKQGATLFKLASGCGTVAVESMDWLAESLRKAGRGRGDIEYFRTLADLEWKRSLPTDLEDQAEDAKRDTVRLAKTRVVMGEADIVGHAVWNTNASGRAAIPPPQRPRTISLQAVPSAARIQGVPSTAPVQPVLSSQGPSARPILPRAPTAPVPSHAVSSSAPATGTTPPLHAVSASTSTDSSILLTPTRQLPEPPLSVMRPIDRYTDGQPGAALYNGPRTPSTIRDHAKATPRTPMPGLYDTKGDQDGALRASLDAHRYHHGTSPGCPLCDAEMTPPANPDKRRATMPPLFAPTTSRSIASPQPRRYGGHSPVDQLEKAQ
ncbi:hypothetical protein Q5752_001767 [Cryptotrichosporon argae]